jgi:GT2 family glycosyltransferase
VSITAIVPVWNGRELLERLFTTLDSQTEPAAEVLAVDNGSTDGAPELARRRGARVIAMGRNTGFAPAVNRGILESRGEWIAVLNSDVELAPDYFATLLASASARDAWFATGKILTAGSKDRMDGSFDAMCRGAAALRAGSGHADGPAFSRPRPIWSAPWTAALFRAELFRRVGLLEESFESYLEDVDFGLRCGLDGFPGIYEPSAVAWHRGSAALGRWHPETVRRIARNQVWLVARHYPAPVLRRNWWPILVAQALWGCVALRHGAGMAWLRGKWQGLRGFSTARTGLNRRDDPQRLDDLLWANERTIYEMQSATGFDFYWRMYFLLTHGEAK